MVLLQVAKLVPCEQLWSHVSGAGAEPACPCFHPPGHVVIQGRGWRRRKWERNCVWWCCTAGHPCVGAASPIVFWLFLIYFVISRHRVTFREFLASRKSPGSGSLAISVTFDAATCSCHCCWGAPGHPILPPSPPVPSSDEAVLPCRGEPGPSHSCSLPNIPADFCTTLELFMLLLELFTYIIFSAVDVHKVCCVHSNRQQLYKCQNLGQRVGMDGRGWWLSSLCWHLAPG